MSSVAAKQVIHMVWFKWPNVSAQNLAACNAAAKKLMGIEGVIEVQFGTNFTERAKGFNLGLYVKLADKAALDHYGPHPLHEEFKAAIAPREDILAMDFEVDAI